MKSSVEVEWSGVKWKVSNTPLITFLASEKIKRAKHMDEERTKRRYLMMPPATERAEHPFQNTYYYGKTMDVIDKPISIHFMFIVCHSPMGIM